jgi:aclacinomycin oxidase
MASPSSPGPPRIGPGDPRYREVVERRFNKRFRASPDYVAPVHSTDEIAAAVQEAVREGRRLAVTSGGHCLEGFVADPEVRVIVDVSPMKRVYFDPERRAVAVEAGATVGETFRALFERWGVVVPLGEHPAIGIGGHVAGGAFGFLCRQLGLAADHLHAVEVVTVDGDGTARAVVATREATDPHRDLWWAHTGGGGGNFGVVSRVWFRSPGAAGAVPAEILPRAPESVTTLRAEWSWAQLGDRSLRRLIDNHGRWCERNAGADSPFASLWALLELHRKPHGAVLVRGVCTAGAEAGRLLHEYLQALADGIAAPARRELTCAPWLEFALNPLPDLFAAPPGGVSAKVKDALLKRRLTDRQVGVVVDHLARDGDAALGGMFGLASYGGRINTVGPDATASVQRDAIADLACSTGWLDPREEADNLGWARAFYGELFSDTGGAPVPGDAYAGALINHPDVDLLYPSLNTSGVPWHTLYYGGNYPQLQRVKARWDPGNVFRHALSIAPPGS